MLPQIPSNSTRMNSKKLKKKKKKKKKEKKKKKDKAVTIRFYARFFVGCRHFVSYMNEYDWRVFYLIFFLSVCVCPAFACACESFCDRFLFVLRVAVVFYRVDMLIDPARPHSVDRYNAECFRNSGGCALPDRWLLLNFWRRSTVV